MSEAHKPTESRHASHDSRPNSLRGRHPTEEGEPAVPSAVPEDEEIVPNRHSASAEAALMHWRETHDES